MTVDHSDHDLIAAGQRTVQQLLFTASQLVEAVARSREHAHRTSSVAPGVHPRWRPAENAEWRRHATPEALMESWASALTSASDDRHAAAAMLRVEHEMRRRWPPVMDRYDGLRVGGGVHPAAAMARSLTEATAAGWRPITPAPAQQNEPVTNRSSGAPHAPVEVSEAATNRSVSDSGPWPLRSGVVIEPVLTDQLGPHRLPGYRPVPAAGRSADGHGGRR